MNMRRLGLLVAFLSGVALSSLAGVVFCPTRATARGQAIITTRHWLPK